MLWDVYILSWDAKLLNGRTSFNYSVCATNYVAYDYN